MRLITLFISVLCLAGCAGTSYSTCNIENWQQLGLVKAMSGGNLQDNAPVNSCSGEVVLAYRAGFELGLEKYCNYEQGLSRGEVGKVPAQSCTDPKWDQYHEGFQTGRQIRATHQRLETIASQITMTRRHLQEVQSSQGAGSLALVDHERIAELRGDIARLSSERDSMNRRLFSLQSEFKYGRRAAMSAL